MPFEYLISKIAASLPNAPKKPIFDLNIPTNHQFLSNFFITLLDNFENNFFQFIVINLKEYQVQ